MKRRIHYALLKKANSDSKFLLDVANAAPEKAPVIVPGLGLITHEDNRRIVGAADEMGDKKNTVTATEVGPEKLTERYQVLSKFLKEKGKKVPGTEVTRQVSTLAVTNPLNAIGGKPATAVAKVVRTKPAEVENIKEIDKLTRKALKTKLIERLVSNVEEKKD